MNVSYNIAHYDNTKIYIGVQQRKDTRHFSKVKTTTANLFMINVDLSLNSNIVPKTMLVYLRIKFSIESQIFLFVNK